MLKCIQSHGRFSEVLKSNQQMIMDILNTLTETELSVSEFYGTCARIAGDDQDFWTRLEEEERKHHAMVCRMMEMVTEKPDRFKMGQSFREGALRTFMGWLREQTRRAAAGAIPAKDLLYVARDIEQSLIESKFHEAIQTDDAAFNGLLSSMHEDTFFHRERISRRIKEKAYSAIILAR
jgi:hypothetical protein